MLRVNLDILSCYKANLKARGMENTKEKIAAALEEAVSKMLGAASKALDAAIAKVKEAHLASSETISRLVPRITKLSIEIATVQDVQNGLNENKVSGDGWYTEHCKLSLLSLSYNSPPSPFSLL